VTRIWLNIEALSSRGEGLGESASGRVHVPLALPGERVEADVDGARGALLSIATASPHRVLPPCPYFGRCGGCSLQHVGHAAYADWKRSLIISALSKYGLTAPVRPLLSAYGEGRRRIVLHARYVGGEPAIGLMAPRSHDLVDIRHCLILSPNLAPALAAARELARLLLPLTPALDLQFTAVPGGLDCDIRGLPRSAAFPVGRAAEIARRHGLLRISLHGEPAVTLSIPHIVLAGVSLPLPAGAFLQATEQGEKALTGFVLEHASGVKRAADLFCGVGTFALPLARLAPVLAVDVDRPSIEALLHASRHAQGLKPVTARLRNLFREPLSAAELNACDLVLFDPPRQGAAAQAKELAASRCRRIIAISCDPLTFARDAAILIAAGYGLSDVLPVDQFQWSAHVEIAALFERSSKSR
jgi:23S rRNA (uracil1939-C5)-methyltransferase